MDLGFCFQDLGDAGLDAGFARSFLLSDPSEDAPHDRFAEVLLQHDHPSSSHAPSASRRRHPHHGDPEDLMLAEEVTSLAAVPTASRHHPTDGRQEPSAAAFSAAWHEAPRPHHHYLQQQQQHYSRSPAWTGSGRLSPTYMALGDDGEDDVGVDEDAGMGLMGMDGLDVGLLDMGSLAGLGSAAASLGFSSLFDHLQAGSLDLPDASSLSFYGIGNLRSPTSSSTAPTTTGAVKSEQQPSPHRTYYSTTTTSVGGFGRRSVPDDGSLQRKRKLAGPIRRGPMEEETSAIAASHQGSDASGHKHHSKEKGLVATGALHDLSLDCKPLLRAVKQEESASQVDKLSSPFAGHPDVKPIIMTSPPLGGASEPVDLVIERQPPVEVRTRTPSENRNFGVTVRITGTYEMLCIQTIEVRLVYAASSEEVNQQILGGKKVVPVREDGRATFDNLSMREASTKHGEREFCLEFVPLGKDAQPLGSFGTRTNPFYAYSHMKVLARRKSVKLRTLNKSHGSIHGGDKMHVIGQPFIKGPSLSIIFSTPHGDVTALNPELYSDSVLFFEAPPYPCPAIFSPYAREPVREIKVSVQVTNDGRTMSNSLEFTYVADKQIHRADF